MLNKKQILVSSIIILILDAIYISIFSSNFDNLVKSIQNEYIKLKLEGAIICYLILIFALNYFILNPKKNVLDAFLLGFVIYSVFDSTNYTIFNKWKGYIVIMDSIWGGVLFSLTTYITYKILN
jgi:uncharacterized membrane protein